MPEILKRCPRCGNDYPPTPEYFHKNKCQSDGLHSYCKKCRKRSTRPVLEDGQKRCARCKSLKPATLAYFSKNKNAKDGLQSWCKDCESENALARRDRRSETNKAYRAQNREKIVKKDKEYKIANKDRYRQQKKDRYKANRQEIIEKERQRRAEKRSKKVPKKDDGELSYYMRNRERVMKQPSRQPDRQIVRSQRQRSRRQNLPSSFSVEQWRRSLDYFGGCCAACGRPMNGLFHTAHADHWIPLSDPDCPGTVVENMVPLCGGQDGCNQSKGTKPAAEWLTEKFGPKKAAEILARIEAYFAWVRAQDA